MGVIARSAGVWDSECSWYPTRSASGGGYSSRAYVLTVIQTTRRYVRVPERRSGRRERSSATVGCYELKTDQDSPRSPQVPSKCRVGLVRRDNACTLKSRPKLGLREHGLFEASNRHAFMPENARRQDEWLRRGSITWLSQSEDLHVTDLKRHHSMIARGQQSDVRRCGLLTVSLTKRNYEVCGGAWENR